jgi:hypothetical protein
LLDDVLDERLARDERERLAGKPRRSKARGNDADDFHTANLATARCIEASSEGRMRSDESQNKIQFEIADMIAAPSAFTF